MNKEHWVTLAVVLLVALVAVWALAAAAHGARRNEHPDTPVGRIAADYDQALVWGGEIVGLATTLAGFLGIAKGAGAALRGGDPTGAGTGLAGVLAGATILGLGGWAAPAALGTLVLGGSAAEVTRRWAVTRTGARRDPPQT